MRFRSAQLTAGFGEALAQGLAPDGGLYYPTEWPHVQPGSGGYLAVLELFHGPTAAFKDLGALSRRLPGPPARGGVATPHDPRRHLR